MSRRRGDAGFTLLELLVAITVLSLMALVMFGGLMFSARVWEHSQARSDGADAISVAENVLRHQLARIYPRWDTQPSGHVVFEGGAQRMQFIAPMPPQFGPGPNQEFQLSLSNNRDLLLAWNPEHPSSAPLLRDVSAIEFSYFGPGAGGGGAVWSDDWRSRPHLPQLIRIRISFPPDDPRTWPELIVRPETVADVTCIYDPISQGCRGRPQ